MIAGVEVENDPMSMNVYPTNRKRRNMNEIVLDKKVLEMVDNLEKVIKEYQRNLNMIFQAIIAQSGYDCQFTLAKDRTKLVEVEKEPAGTKKEQIPEPTM
jgi:hypothetical protein